MTQKINRNSNLNAHIVFKEHRMLICLHTVYGCSHTTSRVAATKSCDPQSLLFGFLQEKCVNPYVRSSFATVVFTPVMAKP